MKRLKTLSMTVLSTLFLLSLAWAITPAGTIIRNQASAKHNGETTLSNEVDTVIRALCIPELSPNGSVQKPSQQANSSQGQTIYLPYTLTNAGNASFTIDLDWAQDSRSRWTPENLLFYQDLNSDAQLSTGEPLVKRLRLASNESATLIMAVSVPFGALGESYISPTATCETGELDNDNYALIRATAGAALQAFKSVSQQKANPGDVLSFNLRVLNTGAAETFNSVSLSDLFSSSDLQGLAYVSGSVQASQGQIRYFDGNNWLANELSNVQGLRVTVDNLAVGEQLSLSFKMLVLTSAEPGKRKNITTAEGPGGPAEVAVDFEISPSFQHHLGPIKNPRALPNGEESADDRQKIPRLIFGQTHCFEHSLENAGNTQDSYLIKLRGLAENVSASLNGFSGEPLAQPLELKSGETRDFLLCLTTASLVGAFTVTLDAISTATNRSNLSFDQVDASVSGSSTNIIKSVDKEGIVDAGETLTYTLTINNANSFDLNDVTVSDELEFLKNAAGVPVPALPTSFISASDEGSFDAASRVVTWKFDRIKSGESKRLSLQVKMPDEPPEGEVFVLANSFVLRAQELANPLKSNTVFHGFPVISIAIDKKVSSERIRVGEVLHYEIIVTNPNNIPMVIELTDNPDERLSYLANTARVKMASNERAMEPSLSGSSLIWDLTNERAFVLQPKGDAEGKDQLSVTYDMLVMPGASGELINTAQVKGSYAFGPESGADFQGVNGISVTSLEVQSAVVLDESALTKPNALLAGRVFLDFNQNDSYDETIDLALPGARVLLSNGWQTLTDVEGRYSFRDLEPGTWQVMLDPVSAPFSPRPQPEALGTGYRHRVVLQGLTVSDFPLEAPLGIIEASRKTQLLFGPLRIEKQLIALPEGMRVVLFVQSSEALPELQIIDSIPNKEDKVFSFDLFEGEQTLSYDLKESIPLTDPNARWRYP